MTNAETRDTNNDYSGHDVDIWRDDEPTRMLMIPEPGDDSACPLKRDGRCACPAGDERCRAFGESFGRTTHDARRDDA